MKETLDGSWGLFRMAWRIHPRKTLLALALMVAGAVSAPLLAVFLGLMTDAVVAGRGTAAALYGVATAVLAALTLTGAHFAHIAYFELSELAELDMVQQLAELSNGSAGIEHHDRAEFADELSVLDREVRQFSNALSALFSSVGLALAMVLTAVLLARLHPVLLLLPLAAAPPLLAGRAAERRLDRSRTSSAEPTRLALNLFRLSTSARHAGELRVFRLRQEMRRRHAGLRADADRVLWRGQAGAAALRAGGQVVFALAYVGTVLLVLRDAVSGRHGIGEVTVVIALAVQVNQQVTEAVNLTGTLQRMGSTLRRVAAVRALVAEPDGPAEEGGLSPADRMREGIELDGVGFAYPGADAPVLNDLRVRIPAGTTVAVVGENGAGKSTLVKLLCGLYRPTSGRVLVDGVDLRRLSAEEWRARISVGLQDFVRYEFRAGTTVGLGDLPRVDDDRAVLDALESAHAGDVVERLPQGLDSQLGKSWTEGAELSGGQWQKLALGRAMMRPAPVLLVLDEPSSALDAETEHQLFERFSEQARQVREAAGAITVLVSHRFSTARMADLILVVRDGHIAESGSHQALMADGGLYAELFGLQAASYR
ncbi:ABC transporter ATP-binding protein/permease (plasmid) [Streptomyces sp. NBC_00441]|uniref:ABC transporter ATP-binding protein n=1 Tax=Streptomyces sp. NBC_00441 TaxID=2975742 RepID=UPI002E29EEA9|nr:ABC transporter ATP-binding protein [Streptomyces sp. NBC_00441]